MIAGVVNNHYGIKMSTIRDNYAWADEHFQSRSIFTGDNIWVVTRVVTYKCFRYRLTNLLRLDLLN